MRQHWRCKRLVAFVTLLQHIHNDDIAMMIANVLEDLNLFNKVPQPAYTLDCVQHMLPSFTNGFEPNTRKVDYLIRWCDGEYNNGTPCCCRNQRLRGGLMWSPTISCVYSIQKIEICNNQVLDAPKYMQTVEYYNIRWDERFKCFVVRDNSNNYTIK